MKHSSIFVRTAKLLCVMAVVLVFGSPAAARKADDMTIAYDFQTSGYILVKGGVGDYTFTITDGTLPPGMRIRQDGSVFALDGKADTAGTWKFSLRITDRRDCCVEREFSYTVQEANCEQKDDLLSGTFTISGDAGTWYQSCVSVKSERCRTFSITGVLPDGLYIRQDTQDNEHNFYLEGVPTTAGDFTFKLRVTDMQTFYAEKSYTVSITGDYTEITEASDMSITKHDFIDSWAINRRYEGYKGSGLGSYLNVYGEKGSLHWSVVNGTLPQGLSLCTQNYYGDEIAYLEGIPNTAGTYTFTLRVIDSRNVYADHQVTMKINNPYEADDMVISGDLAASLKINEKYNGQKYNSQVHVKGNNTGNPEWSIVSGSLPPGLSLIQSGYVKLLGHPVYLEGIPNTAGTYTFTLRATDNRNAYVDRQFTVKINGTPYDADDMSITGNFASEIQINAKHSSDIYIQGCTGTPRWSVVDGTLPPGLSLRPLDSAVYIEGIPNTGGTYTFTLRATDSRNAYAERQFSVMVTGEASSAPAKAEDMSITGNFPDAYVINTWYSSSVQVNGGTEDYTFSISGGTLPPGFFIRQDGGAFYLEGIPADPGTYTFALKVTDIRGLYTENSFSMTIHGTDDEPYPITITTESLWEAGTGQQYSQTLEADISVTSWRITSGDLPDGLTLSETTGTISGMVSDSAIEHNAVSLYGKSYKFEVTASNKFGASTTKSLIIYVHEPIKILTESLPNAKVGEEYSVTLEVSGTSNPLGLVWTVRPASDVPSWLSYPYTGSGSHTCTLSGIPTKAGTYTFTVECGNIYCCDSKKYTLTVTNPETQEKPEFRTHSLLLSGQIGVNFYMNLPDADKFDYTNTYMDFGIAGGSSTPPQYFDPEFMNKKKTYYGFRCYINSVQMADKITATFNYGDGKT
ncbi:MAG: putative Ig domain-containing protein, partial [Synergistaceae bacterium]|nr:putative Ig domain-containing protein [Synergistaceae bacterium]